MAALSVSETIPAIVCISNYPHIHTLILYSTLKRIYSNINPYSLLHNGLPGPLYNLHNYGVLQDLHFSEQNLLVVNMYLKKTVNEQCQILYTKWKMPKSVKGLISLAPKTHHLVDQYFSACDAFIQCASHAMIFMAFVPQCYNMRKI